MKALVLHATRLKEAQPIADLAAPGRLVMVVAYAAAMMKPIPTGPDQWLMSIVVDISGGAWGCVETFDEIANALGAEFVRAEVKS